jgi:succinate dehydrogenase hydrophobic anchor subunit
VLLLCVGAAGVLALERHGWEGLWRVTLSLLHPELLFAFVPLALVLGALVTLVRRIIVRKLEP